MKKLLLVTISILFMSSVIGCGTKDESQMYTVVKAANTNSVTETPEVSPTPTIAPTATPTPEPTPTPVPELTKLEKKYQYYDSDYEDVGELATKGTPEELEASMSGSTFYATWYSLNDATFNQEFKFDKYKVNDKAYGVKCAIYEDAGTFIVYYFYLDDPETILCASSLISEDGLGYYVLTDNDGNCYSTMSAEDIEAYLGIGTEEEYVSTEYVPLTVDELYPYAKESARQQMENELGLSVNDLVFGGFSYEDYFNVFYDYDGQGNYYLRFMIQYHKGSYEVTMNAEVEYTDRDFDGKLDLKDVDLEY